MQGNPNPNAPAAPIHVNDTNAGPAPTVTRTIDDGFDVVRAETRVQVNAGGHQNLICPHAHGEQVDDCIDSGIRFDHAQRDFMADKVSELKRLSEQFKLLKDFLPKGHEDKKRAGELYKKCADRLQVFDKQ